MTRGESKRHNRVVSGALRPDSIRLLLVCVAVAILMTACSRDPKPGTPEAAAAGERLMRSMSETLANSKAFSFETQERIEVIAPSGEKRTIHFTRKTTVRRPSALFFDLHREGETPLEITAYYDGRMLALSEKPDGVWAQTPAPATLDETLDYVIRQFGLPVPIGDVVYSSPYDAFIGPNTRGGLVAREPIDGVRCAKLDYADAFVELRIWIPASGPALPRRLEIVYKQAPTRLVTQLNFTNWELDAPVTDATFAFQPPADIKAIEFPNFVEAMVSRIIPSERQAVSPAVPDSKPAGGPAAR